MIIPLVCEIYTIYCPFWLLIIGKLSLFPLNKLVQLLHLFQTNVLLPIRRLSNSLTIRCYKIHGALLGVIQTIQISQIEKQCSILYRKIRQHCLATGFPQQGNVVLEKERKKEGYQNILEIN